jgi:hypothetical protein
MMVLSIIFWFKVDNCFIILSYDGIVNYLIFRLSLRSPSLFNRTTNLIKYDDFCVTKLKYILHNVQDYTVLYNNAVWSIIFYSAVESTCTCQGYRCRLCFYYLSIGFWLLMVFNAPFNIISVISWRSVLLAENTDENHQPAASH